MAPTQSSQTTKFQDRDFKELLFGIALLWFTLVTCLAVFLFISRDRLTFISGLPLANLYADILLFLSIRFCKPEYTKGWKTPKPVAVSEGFLIAVYILGAFYAVFRVDTQLSRLTVGILTFYPLLALVFGSLQVIGKIEKSKKGGPTIAAIGTSSVAVVLIHAGFAWLLRDNIADVPTGLVSATTFSIGWGLLIATLLTITVSPHKTEHIPHANVAIVTSKKRYKVVTGESVEVGKDETVVMEDLRLRVMSVEYECETKDHCAVIVHAVMNWRISGGDLRDPKDIESLDKLVDTEQKAKLKQELLNKQVKTDTETFLTVAQVPPDMLRQKLHAVISHQIGTMLGKDLVSMMAEVQLKAQEQAQDFALKLGMTVHSVTLTRVQVRFPVPHDAMPAHLEADRLRTLNEAVHEIDHRTLEHVEGIVQAQNERSTSK